MPSKPITLTCLHCGKPFTRTPSDLRKPNRGRYCSRSCSAASRVGERGPAWKGGRKRSEGYIRIWHPDHPNASSEGYVLEHRLVMEAVIGRYLTADEIVHHINGIKDDNRPENLKVMSAAEHGRLHHNSEPPTGPFYCRECGRVDKPHFSRGWCRTCYNRIKRANRPLRPCIECGNQRPHEALGLCQPCYRRHYKRSSL